MAAFKISDKITAIVSDNASNMTEFDEDDDSDIDDAEGTLHTADLPTDADLLVLPKHYPCFAHTLQLVVKDGLQKQDSIGKVISKVSRLVSHVRHSTTASELFSNELKLEIANATRWNSQVRMLRSLLAVSEQTMQQLDFVGKLNAIYYYDREVYCAKFSQIGAFTFPYGDNGRWV